MTYTLNWLRSKFDKGDVLKYIFFWGHSYNKNIPIGKFVLSQWFFSPFVADSVKYLTAEHWMMASKARLFNDVHSLKKILDSEKPGEAKEFGRRIRNFDEKKWNSEKYKISIEGNVLKFSQNQRLADYLVGTDETVLVEASPLDVIWGMGLSENSNESNNPHLWPGQNLLGFALMEVRDVLRNSNRISATR